MNKAFWVEVGVAVGAVAAMGVGFFFNPLITIGIVLVGSAVAGWLAGRGGTFKSFGAGLLALVALTVIFAVCVFGDIHALLDAVLTEEQRILFARMDVNLPSWLPLLCTGIAFAAELLVYLGVFNAAILFKRWYFIAGAAIVLLAEVMYLSIWFYAGIGAVFAAFTENQSFGFIVLPALLLVLLVAWAVCNIRGVKRRTWRNFAWCAGGFAVGSFLVWGVAALTFCVYAGCEIERTASAADPRGKLPKELAKRELELRNSDSVVTLHKRGIELPLETVGMWRGRRGKTVSEEAKKRTLEFAASEEGKAFFARNAELIDLYCRIVAEGEFVPKTSLALLQGYRSAARRCAAQAALAHWRKDAAAILPALEPAEKLEQAIYAHEQDLIEGLVRIAITDLRMQTIIGCGPEAPEYAEQYRAILKRLLAAEPKMPADTGFIRNELACVRRMERGNFTYPESAGAYKRLVNYPTACASLAYKLHKAEADTKLAAEFRKSGRVPRNADNYGKAMRRAMESRAFYATALALKIYNCEKGAYPDKLDELVPGCLEQLPCDPLTGKPFNYKKLPKGGFMLSAQRIKPVKRMLRASPMPRY